MEEKLVTLAIHSFERAQILKTILENHGVEAYLHNVNQIQPIISAGVRVRIKESDLPLALSIVENAHFKIDNESETKKIEPTVLVPIDFSEYAYRACQFAFQYAKAYNLEVRLLHVHFTPVLASPFPMGEMMGYDVNEDMFFNERIRTVNEDLMSFKLALQRQMEEKKIPFVKFDTIMRDGIPEEEILRYIREYKPSMVIMGTRGRHQKDIDIMGSVTAEVVDRTSVPLMALPDKTLLKQMKDIRNIAFLTNFGERDLVSFEALTGFIKDLSCNVHFIHLADRRDDGWNQIKMDGVKNYFARQYPQKQINCTIIEGDKQLEQLDEYIRMKEIDLLSMTNKRKNVFARLFNPGIAKRMLFHSDTPLLVFP